MYLIDTDIIIYALKGNAEVLHKLKQQSEAVKSISMITYGELLYGAAKSNAREKAQAKVFSVAKAFSIQPLSLETMQLFAQIKSSLEIKGIRLADFDLLIAATAIEHGMTLVTNNRKHFSRIKGLEIENWSKE